MIYYKLENYMNYAKNIKSSLPGRPLDARSNVPAFFNFVKPRVGFANQISWVIRLESPAASNTTMKAVI